LEILQRLQQCHRDRGEQLCKKGNTRDRRNTYRILDNIKADLREAGSENVGGVLADKLH
jgi:hypothetical protein